MKKLLLIAYVLLLGNILVAQIPSYQMESWKTITTAADTGDINWPDPPYLNQVSAANKVFLTNSSNFLINGTAGTEYILTQDISGKAIKISGTGTKNAPIVLRGNSDSNDPSTWPEISGGSLSLAGQRVIVYRLRFNDCAVDISNGSWLRVARNVFYNYNRDVNFEVILVSGNVQHVRVDRNNIGRFFGKEVSNCIFHLSLGNLSTNPFPTYVDFCRNLVSQLTENAGSATAGSSQLNGIFLGTSHGDTDKNPKCQVFCNLINNNEASIAWCEVKCSNVKFFDNTIDMRGANAGKNELRIRHGNSQYIARNLVLEPQTGTPFSQFNFRDGGTTAIDNACVKPDGTVGVTKVFIWSGNGDWHNWYDGTFPYPSAGDSKVGGNRMEVVVGGTTSWCGPVSSDSNIVAPTLATRVDRNYKVTFDLEKYTDSKTIVAGAKYGRPLTALTKNDVGILALPPGGNSYNELPGWVTFNSLIGNPPSVFKSTPGNAAGTTPAAAKIQPVVLATNPAPAKFNDTVGVMFTGTMDPLTKKITYGFPYSSRPVSLDFYYKYAPATSGDTATVKVVLQRWVSGKRDIIGSGVFKFSKNNISSGFVAGSLPIVYNKAGLPDTAIIYVYSGSIYKPKIGSVFYVDDFSLVESPLSITEQGQTSVINVYPNPATEFINFYSSNKEAAIVQLYSLDGRIIFSGNIKDDLMQANVSGLARGAYIYVVSDSEKRIMQRGKIVLVEE